MEHQDYVHVSLYDLPLKRSEIERPELERQYHLYKAGAKIEFHRDEQQVGQGQKIHGCVTTEGERHEVEISIDEGGRILESTCHSCGDSIRPCEHAGAFLFKRSEVYQVAGETSIWNGVTAKDMIIPLAIGALAIVAALIVTDAGFSSTGIVRGSWAAKMMSRAAAANGGGVAAGSVVAYLQSVGAAGIGVLGYVVIFIVTVVLTVAVRTLLRKIYKYMYDK